MASSFRSHFRRASHHEDVPSNLPQNPPHRMPPPPSHVESTQKKTAIQGGSKLKKKASTAFAAVDKPNRGERSVTRAPSAVVTGLGHALASRRSSVTPHPDVIPSRSPAPPNLGHNFLSPAPIMRTPSLVSGSSASTFDSPKSNGLRRKPSHIDKHVAQKKAGVYDMSLERATTYRNEEDYPEEYDDSILGVALPSTSIYASAAPSASAAISLTSPQSSRDREWYASRTTSPTPNYALSTASSTRYTDSPFSHAPTISSVSSYSSPAAINGKPISRTSMRTPSRGQASDSTRLALHPVRESSISSSNSTAKSVVQKRENTHQTSSRPSTSRPIPAARAVSREKVPSSISAPVQHVVGKSSLKGDNMVQVPPELAHLNIEAPIKKSISTRHLPPHRPSRDGTANLPDISRPSPVVQSDLSTVYTTYHKRTPSQETPASPTMRSRFGIPSKSPSKHASPRVDSAVSPPPSARIFARGPTPEIAPSEQRRLARKDSPVVGPSPSPSKSHRFGLFSRKPKADVAKPTETAKRDARKGPTAGTGHEGYARIGARGRSGSATSSADFRSTSVDSNTSTKLPTRSDASRKPGLGSRKNSLASGKSSAELDDFLKERLNPVILRGSGSTVSKSASNIEMANSSLQASSNTSSLEVHPKPQLLPSAIPHGRRSSPYKRPALGQRMQSDSSDDGIALRYPSLATRRSLTRLSQMHGRSPISIPAPIITDLPAKKSSIDSYDAEGSAWPQSDSTLPPGAENVAGKDKLWLRPQQTENLAKPARKWNFFQRAQSSPRLKEKQRAAELVNDEPPSSLQPSYRNVGHYNLLEPVSPVSLGEVEAMVHDHDLIEDSMSETQPLPKVVPYEHQHVSLLPSPPLAKYKRPSTPNVRLQPPQIMIRQNSEDSPELLRAQTALPRQTANIVEIPKSPIIPDTQDASEVAQARSGINAPNTTPELLPGSLTTSNETGLHESPRQPRLSPVGRIPRVVSKRDRDRKLPDNSFSRPFVRNQPNPSVKPPGTLYNQIRELASPIEAPSQPVSTFSTGSEFADPNSNIHTSPPSDSTARTSMDFHASNEFLAFSRLRKNSELSYSSSSSSWAHTLAAQPPQVDDPWNEFDDLLDDMLPRRRVAGSHFAARYYASTLPSRSSSSEPPALSFGHQHPPPTSRLPSPPGSQPKSTVLSVPQQIARFMQPSMSPLVTPHSLSEFVDRYGRKSSSSTLFSDHSRNSALQPGGASARGSSCSRNSRASVHSRSTSLPETDAWFVRSSVHVNTRSNRDTQLLGIAENDVDDTASHANLRFGALMTSKWLSFGRVLFSPAHNEMRLADEPRVLVLDGLGSDWSYYVALSYPSASVYNLGPTTAKGSTTWPGINQKPPPNHKQYTHEALSAAFPFPKGFFTAVVFRFPIATTEETYHACLSECKRVLRPGGYLEVAVLDLDLMNMGNKARKAVRDLKTRMQFHDQTVSLRNMSDVLIQEIGRRGFGEVQRCMVGVPVAGRIPRSQDVDSDTSQGSDGRRDLSSTDQTSDPEVNFADLLQGPRNSQYDPSKSNNDEGITKMVARVGRWWYSTCHEMPLLQNRTSIWDDTNLLRECEKQGTSFKLLICHAQKPAQTRRRTVSV